MRLLVISDVHGNLPALNAILNNVQSVEGVICSGDLAGYYPYVNEVIETVLSMDNLICVKGNHDHVLLDEGATTGSGSADLAIGIQRKMITDENKRRLASLPEKKEFVIEGRRCLLFHGSPADPLSGRDAFWEKGLNDGIYIFGHSHTPFLKEDAGRRWLVVNPGSSGMPRDGDPRASCAVLDTANWSVAFHRFGYPMAGVAERCRAVGLPENFIKTLEAGRWIRA